MSGDDEDIRDVADEQVDGEIPEQPDGAARDAETLRRIVELNRNVTAARETYETADRARKVAKEELEDEQAVLNRFIASLDEDLPLFDRGGDAEAAAEDLSWREVCLETLTDPDGKHIPPAVLQALSEHDPELGTLGQVADWSRSGRDLIEVKGIGEAKADQVVAAIDYYWARRKADQLKAEEPVDVDRELSEGCREAEAHKGAAGVPQDAPAGAPGWRDVTVGDLGLAEATVAILDRQTIATVGELVAIARMGAGWMGTAAQIDVDEALIRFRGRRSNDEIAEFDLARDGEPVAPRGRASRGRRAGARAPA